MGPSSSLLVTAAIGHLRDLKSKCEKLIEQINEINPVKDGIIDQIEKDFNSSPELKKEFSSLTTPPIN